VQHLLPLWWWRRSKQPRHNARGTGEHTAREGRNTIAQARMVCVHDGAISRLKQCPRPPFAEGLCAVLDCTRAWVCANVTKQGQQSSTEPRHTVTALTRPNQANSTLQHMKQSTHVARRSFSRLRATSSIRLAASIVARCWASALRAWRRRSSCTALGRTPGALAKRCALAMGSDGEARDMACAARLVKVVLAAGMESNACVPLGDDDGCWVGT